MVRMQLESCDCCDSFVFLQSLGGGTGSGLGSFILESVADAFQDVCRIVSPVFPSSKSENVITAPYNAVLSAAKLCDFANVVFPVDNDALGILDDNQRTGILNKTCSFDSINSVVAGLLSELSASARFGGERVLYPSRFKRSIGVNSRHKFLLPSIGGSTNLTPRDMKQNLLEPAIADAWNGKRQLLSVDTKRTNPYHTGLLVRSGAPLGDIISNIKLQRPNKSVEILSVTFPVVKTTNTVIRLQNTIMMNSKFIQILDKFNKLYSRKAHIHHYTEYIEESVVKEAVDRLFHVIGGYEAN
jgi:tubulin epsilon